jgi:DNA-binding response OmpR family regulator
MTAPTRPPPRVLIIHDGNSVDAYVSYLRSAGLQASETHADDAVAEALAMDPDIIVLDYDCDGETVAALQSNVRTRGIPVIALADLPPVSAPPT